MCACFVLCRALIQRSLGAGVIFHDLPKENAGIGPAGGGGAVKEQRMEAVAATQKWARRDRLRSRTCAARLGGHSGSDDVAGTIPGAEVMLTQDTLVWMGGGMQKFCVPKRA